MKTQHRLLPRDQNPVEDGLLFGTELGKSVKDLSESSKVTSKVILKQKRHQQYSIVTLFRSIVTLFRNLRPFHFSGWGRGTIAIQAERWISKVTTEKPTLPASTLVTSQGRKMEMCSGEC